MFSVINVMNAIQLSKTVLGYLRASILRKVVEHKHTAEIIHQNESITIDSIRQLKRGGQALAV